MIKASKKTGIKNIAVSGGVSANSYLKKIFEETAKEHYWNLFIPSLQYSTDNAAMIAIIGYYKYKKGITASHKSVPKARIPVSET